MKVMYIGTHPKMIRTLFSGQLRYMREQGYDVCVVLPPAPELEQDARREGVRVFPVEIEREIAPLKDLRTLLDLVRLMRRERPDIVNAGAPKGGLLGMIAAWLTRVPLRIYLLRGLRLETTTGAKRAILSMTERIASWCSQHVVAISESLKVQFLELQLCPEDKIVVLGAGSSNGVEVERFARTPERASHGAALKRELSIPDDAPVLGFVGRITRDKGAAELLEGFKAVRKERSDVHLVMVGDYEDGDAVSDAVRRGFEQEAGVSLVGFVDDPERYYHAFDVLLFPTHREGFGNVALEASMAEVPVVAFDVTGVRDSVAHGVSGTLVPLGDSVGLARAALRYVNEPEHRRKHGEFGRERAETEFGAPLIWKAWKDAYERWWTARREERR